jgi:two-component system, NtrC family, sensor histidine kinase HydH
MGRCLMWKNVVAPAILVVLFWVISSITTTYYINWLEKSHASIIADTLGTIQATGSMRYTLRQMQRILVNPASDDGRAAVAGFDALERRFRKELAAAADTSVTPEETRLIAKIQHAFEEYRNELRGELNRSNQATFRTAADIEPLQRLADGVAEACKDLGDLQERLMNEATARRLTAAASLNVIRYAFLVVGPVAGLAWGFWISRRFHRSISQISVTLSDAATEMATVVGRINVTRADGLASLQEQVATVVARIRSVLDELHQARREAFKSARLAAIGELAAGVAHELRNPLTSVKLLIQTGARRHPERPLTDTQLRIVQEEIARMESVIESLLGFARPARINRTRHDLRDTVNRALNLVAGRAAAAQVSVAMESHPQPIEVLADAEQLHQVFTNLLANGIDAMPAGGTMTVSIHPADATGSCRVVFADTGMGIPPEVRDRLFEPFVTGKARGTGLGLAVSRRVVQEHGGTLSGTNRPEGGAVFTVELPAIPAGAAIQETAGTAQAVG